MSETIRGHHTATQTLSAATPSVTIAGAITAYGPAGLYLRQGTTAQINAALFAPATATFNIVNQGYIGATIPGSPHPVIDYGIALGAAATLTNTGTITGPAGIGAFGTATTSLLNSGHIYSDYYAGIDVFNAPAYISNSGNINAEGIGIQLHQGGQVTNARAGFITGTTAPGITSQGGTTISNAGDITGTDGIALLNGANTILNTGVLNGKLAGIAAYTSPLALYNSGYIFSQYGLLLDAGGQITDSGLISGSGVAIKNTGPLSLILTPGARFSGAVDDTSGGGALTLAGATAGYLNIGADFFGVPNITFAPGSTWTLAGTASDLATGQTLSGFNLADTLILDGFAATSETFGAAGLTLSNATASATLGLNPLSGGQSLAIQTYFGDTTLAAALPTFSILGTITGFYAGAVTLGVGSIAANLTISNSGTVVSGPAVLGYYPTSVILEAGATLTNFGIVKGGAEFLGTGVILNQGNIGGVSARSGGGTIINTGLISEPINLAYGGTVIDSGKIEPSKDLTDAITDTGPFSLILEPSANLPGDVDDTSGTGQLTLAGNGPGFIAIAQYDLGAEHVRGFNDVTFAGGSTWTLEGNKADLASGQTIAGFAPADTIILDGFTATSYSITPGIGLVLSNSYASETLSLATIIPGQAFTLGAYSGNTTITGTIGLAPIVIGTATTTGLIPSSGETITITPSGAIETPGPAIFIGATVSNVHILNNGAIITPLTALPAIYDNGAGVIVNNNGSINAQQGVYLSHSGTLFNAGGISGPASNFGVRMTASSLQNSGTIAAAVDGIVAFVTSNVTNSGSVSGGEFGVILDASTVTNTGNITSTFTGADVLTYGTLLNAGAISSAAYGVIGYGLGFITNTGNIWGKDDGASLEFSNSTFFNGGFASTFLVSTLVNTGSIGGGDDGLKLSSGLADVTNAGTISGGSAAIQAAGTFTLTAEPGAVFNGAVLDSASAGVLILAGTTAGSLDIAPDFSGFSTLGFAPGSSWSLEATATQLAGAETIAGFAPGDTLILDGFAATAASYAYGAGLALSNATGGETLLLTSSYSADGFAIGTNAAGGTDITVACFLRGTRILTPKGNVPIEKLDIGDRVTTLHGEQPIRWIGRRAYANRFVRNNLDVLPIRIRRHAIAFNVPSRDLYVSPDHAICEGGVLIHVHLLQNGISIHQPATDQDIEYFHLEFDTHTILFAENLSAESFIDEGAGNRFQNSHTRIPPAKPQTPCLPRVFEGFHLHNIKSRIASRAGIRPPSDLGGLLGVIDECTPTLIRGWAQNSTAPEHPVTLEIISGSYNRVILANAFRPDLRAHGLGSGCHGFSLPLPNLQHPVSIRRIPGGAILPPPQPRHASESWHPRLLPPRHASESWHPRLP